MKLTLQSNHTISLPDWRQRIKGAWLLLRQGSFQVADGKLSMDLDVYNFAPFCRQCGTKCDAVGWLRDQEGNGERP